jgi:hypothetical protein
MTIWDRHNDIFIYGALDKFILKLRSLGFTERKTDALDQHQHHYNQEFDTEAAAVLTIFDWHRTPLRPKDGQ